VVDLLTIITAKNCYIDGLSIFIVREGDLNYNPHVDYNMDKIINIIDATPIGWNWQKQV
jgi:hypothetical protein